MHDEYKLLSVIGHGAYGSLWLGTDNIGHQSVAIKCVAKDQTSENLEKVHKLCRLTMQFNHPFVVSTYDTFDDERSIHSVMEFCSGGTLMDMLQKGPLPEDRAAALLTEVLLALKYLHNECHVVHRDVKPENILIDAYGHVRLADFGFLTDVDCKSALLRTACGSPAFTAPEVMKREKYNVQADVWSFGVVMYVTLFGNLPFHETNIMGYMQRVICDDISIPTCVSEEARDLLTKILEKDWQKRLTVDDILRHPWICERSTFTKIMSLSMNRDHLYKEALSSCITRHNEPVPFRPDSVQFKIHRDSQVAKYIAHMLWPDSLEPLPSLVSAVKWRTAVLLTNRGKTCHRLTFRPHCMQKFSRASLVPHHISASSRCNF